MASKHHRNSIIGHLARSLGNDKKLVASLAISFASTAAFARMQLRSPEVQQQIKMHTSAPRALPAIPPKAAPAGHGLSAPGKEVSVAEGGKVELTAKVAPKKKSSGAAVDGKFLERLLFVLRIVIPGPGSKEAFLLLTQMCVLTSRTLLSLRIARLGGDGLQAVLERSWRGFGLVMVDFFLSGVGAAVINSALKYLTNSITVAFRQRLTSYVHEKYLESNSYYKAAILRVGNLDNADQRIVEDLNQFCATAADLFSRTFKPAMDVVLSTWRMQENMGWKGLSILYTYFVCSGGVVRALSPPFSKYIAEIQKREGDFRASHSRLITNAEEVAFLHGSAREKGILNQRLADVTAFSSWYFLLQFRQGCIDQYVLKYFASIIGWPIIAVPFLMKRDLPVEQVAALYRESDSLIQSASASIGDLLLVYKKLQRLAGFTTRVVELLEAVEESKGAHAHEAEEVQDGDGAEADAVQFRDITIHSPDQRLLVKSVNLTIRKGENLLVTGANGAGKTSLFRCLAGLWKPTAGTITVGSGPSALQNGKVSVFYVPQRPYLVTGSLRDQVTYPLAAGPEADEAVLECLRLVNLTKLVDPVHNPEGLAFTPHDWAGTLSGGEKQRVGLARLYYHRPKWAVLDEATSAVNPDEEGRLYQQVIDLGITVFSIAHRLELRRFHHNHLHYIADGTGSWTLKSLRKSLDSDGAVNSD